MPKTKQIDLMAQLKASLAEGEKIHDCKGDRSPAGHVVKVKANGAMLDVRVESVPPTTINTPYHNELIDAGFKAFEASIPWASGVKLKPGMASRIESAFRGTARGMIDEAMKPLRRELDERE